MCLIVLSGDVTSGGLSLSWTTLFQIFMFSLSLSTGLQPEIAPLSPYTLVLANFNALFAQLIFVFLSGAGIILLSMSCNLELPRMHVVASELLLSNLHFYEHVFNITNNQGVKLNSFHCMFCVAVFARLSQPSQPVRCSTVALICPSLAQRRRRVDSSATK